MSLWKSRLIIFQFKRKINIRSELLHFLMWYENELLSPWMWFCNICAFNWGGVWVGVCGLGVGVGWVRISVKVFPTLRIDNIYCAVQSNWPRLVEVSLTHYSRQSNFFFPWLVSSLFNHIFKESSYIRGWRVSDLEMSTSIGRVLPPDENTDTRTGARGLKSRTIQLHSV